LEGTIAVEEISRNKEHVAPFPASDVGDGAKCLQKLPPMVLPFLAEEDERSI
jgi:hypothetical protein